MLATDKTIIYRIYPTEAYAKLIFYKCSDLALQRLQVYRPGGFGANFQQTIYISGILCHCGVASVFGLVTHLACTKCFGSFDEITLTKALERPNAMAYSKTETRKVSSQDESKYTKSK